MFNRALFKQSCKANFVKWLICTLSTCFMLLLIILVLGNIQITDVRDSIVDVFTTANNEASLKVNAIDSYDLYLSSIDVEHTLEGLSNGHIEVGENEQSLKQGWNAIAQNYELAITDFEDENGRNPTDQEKEEIINQLAPALIDSLADLAGEEASSQLSDEQKTDYLSAILKAYDGNSIRYGNDSQEFFTQAKNVFINAYRNMVANDTYKTILSSSKNEEFADAASSASVVMVDAAMKSYTGDGTQASYDKQSYQVAGRDYVITLMQSMADYQMPEDYTEDEKEQFALSVKVISNTAISTYQLWLDEGMTKTFAKAEAAKNISDQMPEHIAEVINELSTIDLTGLFVGEMFYHIAGLLIPIVFVITTANGLLAGQVDSGSMAYILSTPTKRRTVTFTQMSYLVLSIFAMFALLMTTSLIGIAFSGGNAFAINYAEVCTLNLGGFLTCFAFAGICFMTSAIFNRSKYSFSLGGGFTIFSIVCTILGLFGSKAMPSIMRVSSMNFFNYLSIISLFDASGILGGNFDVFWKFLSLVIIGSVCFVIGMIRFEKKDLPL